MSTIGETMASRRAISGFSEPSRGWAVASLLALLGVAFASEYLFPRAEESSSEPLPARSRSVRSEKVEADDDDHGRHAATPSEIPARGWKDILLRVYANVSKHRVSRSPQA